MKILHLIKSKNFAGSERVALMLCKAQIAEGHDVMLGYCFDGDLDKEIKKLPLSENSLTNASIKTVQLHKRLPNTKLYRTIKSFQPDVVHYHLTGAARLAPTIAKRCTTKHVFHLHVNKNSKIFRQAAKMGRLVAISKTTRDFYTNETLIPKNAIDLIHNGNDFQHSTYSNTNKQVLKKELLNELKLPTNASIILLSGRISMAKGQIDLIHALPLVLKHFPSTYVLFAGSAKSHQKYLNTLNDAIKTYTLEKHFLFLGWRSDIERLSRAADIQVVPSRHEPFGLVVLEAMAMETPVISTGVDGIGDILTDESCGLLYSPGDNTRLAQKICYLLDTPSARETLTKNALDLLDEKFSIEVFNKKVMDVYKKTPSFSRN